MALLDFLKKKEEASAAAKAKADREKAKKPAAKARTSKQPKKQDGRVLDAKRPESASIAKVSAPARIKAGKFSYEAVRYPHISEKATYLSENDQYVFQISPKMNKKEVKHAVEGIYKVNVLSVNMVKIPAKKRRLGRTEGWRKSFKKAIVKIKNGQKIEIL